MDLLLFFDEPVNQDVWHIAYEDYKEQLTAETDLNNNGVPDNKEIVLLVENYLKNKKEKENKKILKKILK